MSKEGANMSQGGHENHDITATINNIILPEITANLDSGKIGGGSMTAIPADVPVLDIKGKAIVVGEDQEAGCGKGNGIFLPSAEDVVAGGRGEGGAGKRTAEAEHEMHIWTERERRKKMKCMFSNLHALLPNLPAKADKASIVGEAANYIKTLQATYHKLQMRKLDRLRAQLAADVASTSALPSASQPHLPPAAPAATRESVLADMAHVWNSQQAAVQSAPAAMPSAVTAHTARPVFNQTWSARNIILNMAGEDAYISVCMPRQRGVLQTVLLVLEKHRIEVVTAQISSDASRTMFTIQAHAAGPSSQSSERLMPEDRFKLAVSEMMLWLSN